MSNQVKGNFLTLFGASCWGISGCTGQYLFSVEGMDSKWLVPIRLLLAGLILCGYFLFRDGKALFAPWKTAVNIRDLLIYGLLGVSGCQFLYFLCIQYSNAGMATILQDLFPVMVLGIVCLKQKRLPRPVELLSLLFALAGLVLVTTHGQFNSLAVSPVALAAGCLSAVCVVIYNMWPRNLQAQFPTPMLQGWAFLLGGTFFMIVFHPWTMGYHPTPAGYLGIAVVVLVGNVLAFSCYMQGVKMIGPQRASLLSFAEPITAAVIGVTFLGTPFTFWDALGFGCFFIMLVLLALPARSGTKDE